jgi:hypothetical protein
MNELAMDNQERILIDRKDWDPPENGEHGSHMPQMTDRTYETEGTF